jgi:small subunit ribosomal protein S1
MNSIKTEEIAFRQGVTENGLDAQESEILEQHDSAEMGELPLADWDYQRPKRGQVRTGVILAIHEQEIIVGVDAKRDGVVPYADMQRLGQEELAKLSVGDQVPVYILRPEDQDGNLLVSLFQAQQASAWQRAAELAESGEAWEGEVVGYNKGGLLVPLDSLRGFVPASQVPGFPQGLSQEERLQKLASMVGETLTVKVIEINRRNRRLILSATAARRQWRKRQRERLLDDMREGEVREGIVSSLCSFGAFVDLGGADGLIHISELSWRRVRHPREVLKVGEEVEVYVLRLDEDRKRIGLSLKRLQPEPWSLVEDKYELGQLVEGMVTNVVDFGAFAEIEAGVEGLIHVSELADGQITHPRDVVHKGDLLLLRIIRIDVRRKRLGLSLKRVLESEWAEWAARLAQQEAEKQAETEEEPETPVAEDQDTEEPTAEQGQDSEQEPEAEAAEEPVAEKDDTSDQAENEPEAQAETIEEPVDEPELTPVAI